MDVWTVTLMVLMIQCIPANMEDDKSCQTSVRFVNNVVTSLELDCLALVVSSTPHAQMIHSYFMTSTIATRLVEIEQNSTGVVFSAISFNKDCMRPAVFCLPCIQEVKWLLWLVCVDWHTTFYNFSGANYCWKLHQVGGTRENQWPIDLAGPPGWLAFI